MRELQDSYETEQQFATLYKTQTNELKEELEEKNRLNKEFEEERISLKHQCQISMARADSEALARSIAEETVADLEKEKTMRELELKDLLAKHRNEVGAKDSALSASKEREMECKRANEQLLKEKEELSCHFKQVQDELVMKADISGEVERLLAKLKTESLLKQQAVNKLHEVLNRKDIREGKGKSKDKVSSADLRRKEKDLKKLQQELTQEKEKFIQVTNAWQKNIQDLQVSQLELVFDRI